MLSILDFDRIKQGPWAAPNKPQRWIHYCFSTTETITDEDCAVGFLTNNDRDFTLILAGNAEAIALERDGQFIATVSYQVWRSGAHIAIATLKPNKETTK